MKNPIEKITVEKPWGKYDVFYRNIKSSVKILTLEPHCCLSLQYHKKRDEYCYILSGEAISVLGKKETHVRAGDEVWIPRKMIHRFKTVNQPMSYLEIQFGHSDEEDIVRLEDSYGRQGSCKAEEFAKKQGKSKKH